MSVSKNSPGSTPVADIDEDPNVEIRPFSSPPCYAHEIDPAYFGLTPDKTSPDETMAVQRLVRHRHAVEEAAGILAALLSRR